MHTTLPRHFYADPDFYRVELERFFFNRWICAGRADQIPNPGDYFARALGNESVIVTRDTTGESHELFNVCRYGGTRLGDRPDGHFVERMQCPYHAWTYDLAGRLLAAPHMPKEFCRDEYPLHRAGCDAWDGHIFIFLGNDAARPSLATQLADLPARFAAWKMGDLRLGRRIVYDGKANWKPTVLNYNDGRHAP